MYTNGAKRVDLKDNALFKNWGTFSKAMDQKSIWLGFANHLEYSLSKDRYTATMRDLYHALALTVRDRLTERWIRTQQCYYDHDVKRVYYLSAEYLMGRALLNNMINLGMYEPTKAAVNDLNLDLDQILEQEPDAGLGNGGLGRLAACFLDSLATLEIPAYGYGIRYEFGIFDQAIRNCQQVEKPETWLKFGNPWEIERPEYSFTVKYYGRTKQTTLPSGQLIVEWVDTDDVVGVAYDTPVAGYDNNTVNTLRLWAARTSKEFDLQYFQHGDYLKAVEEKFYSENISKVLYPNDAIAVGRELRLKQQYFFLSCSIQDIIRRYLVTHKTFEAFPDKAAIQMNDTHPALAVAELMRLLIDKHNLDWDYAWDITTRTCAYTNHTLLQEALERWSVAMFGRLLPRHLEIIYEINRRFLRDVSVRYVGDTDRQKRMSIIEEGPEQKIRMAYLAIVGSHSVNGVSALHSRLLTQNLFKDFHEFTPEKFNNKTNGITPRRWLLAGNQPLAKLITERLGGKAWAKNLDELKKLETFAKDPAFLDEFYQVKRDNKTVLARVIKDLTGVKADPESIFDVQVKRIHEYKRQMLNLLHVVNTWLRLKEDRSYDIHPRTYIFGGKAAPGYVMAKNIISLICHVADMINRDGSTNGRLKAVFIPNYRVSLAEKIFPATDVSEQISTAGFEASGTGNMKFCLNGSVIIGTLDGANVEIKDEVGDDNIFIFGMTADEVSALQGRYRPRDFLDKDPRLQRVFQLIKDGFFSPDQPMLFHPLIDNLTQSDPFMVLADFAAYRDCQERVDLAFRDRASWTKKAVLNVSRMGKLSSDRTIAEYNDEIWKAKPLTVDRGGK